MTKSYCLFQQPEVRSIIIKNHSDRCERPVIELVEFIGAHQSVSLVLVLIDDSLRVIVCSVWGHVGDVRSESLGTGDILLLLVAFDYKLKIFHPLLIDNMSGEHP
ncbi:hypothetical protein Tco_1164843 [Tanacetum coccineum]